MSAKAKLLELLETESKKKDVPGHLELHMDTSSDGDVGAIWYAVGKEDEDFEDGYPTEGEDWDNALKAFVSDRFQEFDSAFEDKAEEEGSLLKVTRCVAVDDVQKFTDKIKKSKYQSGYKGVGVYWSWDEDKADCHWAKGKDHVVLQGLVDVKHIDVAETLLKNLHPSLGEDEAEIKLAEGAPVILVQVQGSDDKPLWDGKVEVKASSYSGRIGRLMGRFNVDGGELWKR